MALCIEEISLSSILWWTRLNFSLSVGTLGASDCAVKQPMLRCPGDGNTLNKAVEARALFEWGLRKKSGDVLGEDFLLELTAKVAPLSSRISPTLPIRILDFFDPGEGLFPSFSPQNFPWFFSSILMASTRTPARMLIPLLQVVVPICDCSLLYCSGTSRSSSKTC